VEKPPCGSSAHCIGVRTASRSGRLEVVAHAELVAVADHRRAGQREHHAVGELLVAPVAEHGREPAADAAVVELHLSSGAKRANTCSRCSS
jgi:hypothetical protein